MASLRLPPHLRFDLPAVNDSGPTIASEAQRFISESTQVLDSVAASIAAPSWSSTIAPLIALDRDGEALNASITFIKNVAVDKAIRDASSSAATLLSSFEVTAGMRHDVYSAVAAYAVSEEAKRLTGEAGRFVSHTLRDFKRRGLHLPEETRVQVQATRTAISDATLEFQRCLAEVDAKLYFTAAQLAGLPPDFISSLPTAEEVQVAAAPQFKLSLPLPLPPFTPGEVYFELSLSYPHVVPLLKLCAVPSTRAVTEYYFNSRAHPGNTALLEQVVALRSRAAALLGYPNHAAYVCEDKMVGDVPTVTSFLSRLAVDLKHAATVELESLMARKRAAEGEGAAPITMWDYRYYMEGEVGEKYSVDFNAIREYFPLATVTRNMMAMYERLLNLKISEVTEGDTRVWHEEVQLFDVKDATSGETLGYFYLDMYPRPGKYSHAAVFPLISGCEGGPPTPVKSGDSERIVPVCAMLCNFNKAAPSLLRHEEVVTYFHELGHVCHHLLSSTRFARFASFRCEQDFVEAPSQMLENWCWTPATLCALSGHHTDASKKLPEADAVALARTRIAHAGISNIRQVFLATFDMTLHTRPADLDARAEDVKVAELLQSLHSSVLGIPMTPGTCFGASFGHLCGGYDSQYYGYLWSEVYACDMFESMFSADPMNAAMGLRYRERILSRGGSQDARDFLRDFLGREPSTAAFLKQKGLAPPAAAVASS